MTAFGLNGMKKKQKNRKKKQEHEFSSVWIHSWDLGLYEEDQLNPIPDENGIYYHYSIVEDVHVTLGLLSDGSVVI